VETEEPKNGRHLKKFLARQPVVARRLVIQTHRERTYRLVIQWRKVDVRDRVPRSKAGMAV